MNDDSAGWILFVIACVAVVGLSFSLAWSDNFIVKNDQYSITVELTEENYNRWIELGREIAAEQIQGAK